MRFTGILSILILSICGTLGLIWTIGGSDITRKALQSWVRESCPECRFSIGSLDVSIISGKLSARKIEFVDDPSSKTRVNFFIPTLEMKLNPSVLWGAVPVIERLEIDGLGVTVRERDIDPPGPSPRFPPPGYATRGLPPLRGKGISVHNGLFNYEFEIFKKVARIQVNKVEAKIGSFATRDYLVTNDDESRIHMNAKAVLESSGKVTLDVVFSPFAEKNRDEIKITLTDQKLSELNPFFSIEDGIKLSGVLHKAHAQMILSESKLTGKLTANYEGLGFDIHSTPDQSALKAFLMNTISSLKLVPTRPRKGEENEDKPEAAIQFPRKPHMPIIKWLLAGLKEAANKIMSGEKK